MKFKATIWLESDSILRADKLAQALRETIDKGFDWITVHNIVVNAEPTTTKKEVATYWCPNCPWYHGSSTDSKEMHEFLNKGHKVKVAIVTQEAKSN